MIDWGRTPPPTYRFIGHLELIRHIGGGVRPQCDELAGDVPGSVDSCPIPTARSPDRRPLPRARWSNAAEVTPSTEGSDARLFQGAAGTSTRNPLSRRRSRGMFSPSPKAMSHRARWLGAARTGDLEVARAADLEPPWTMCPSFVRCHMRGHASTPPGAGKGTGGLHRAGCRGGLVAATLVLVFLPLALLGSVSDAVRLPDGRLVVADGQTQQVRRFDASGTFVRNLGRAGRDPGEYRRPSRSGAPGPTASGTGWSTGSPNPGSGT